MRPVSATSCFLATDVRGRTGTVRLDGSEVRVAVVTSRSSRTITAGPYSKELSGSHRREVAVRGSHLVRSKLEVQRQRSGAVGRRRSQGAHAHALVGWDLARPPPVPLEPAPGQPRRDRGARG